MIPSIQSQSLYQVAGEDRPHVAVHVVVCPPKTIHVRGYRIPGMKPHHGRRRGLVNVTVRHGIQTAHVLGAVDDKAKVDYVCLESR